MTSTGRRGHVFLCSHSFIRDEGLPARSNPQKPTQIERLRPRTQVQGTEEHRSTQLGFKNDSRALRAITLEAIRCGQAALVL